MMKKIILLIVVVAAVLVGVFAYLNNKDSDDTAKDQTPASSQQTEEKDVRQATWEQLPAESQERIKGTWEDATATKMTLAKGATISTGDDIVKVEADRQVYLVDFTTKTMGVPNNMIVYVDADSYDIVGYGLVD